MEMKPLIEVRALQKSFFTDNSMVAKALGTTKIVNAVNNVDLSVYPGEILGVVGESGCGKSTLARCLMLLEMPTSGTISYKDKNIVALTKGETLWFRKQMQMVFQDPQSSLNRAKTIFQIINSPLKIHRGSQSSKDAKLKVKELLNLVGLHEGFLHRYPHELSGGQRQRVGIARALAVEPEVLVLDEPVSALDVSIQAQVINLLEDLQSRLDLTYIFISHDLSLVNYLSDRVAVMYLGRIVEIGDVDEVFDNPTHPYTKLLLSAAPSLDPDNTQQDVEIIGEVPSPVNPPTGCPFHPRCPDRMDVCDKVLPERMNVNVRLESACHLVGKND